MYGTLMYGTLKSWRIDLRSAPQKICQDRSFVSLRFDIVDIATNTSIKELTELTKDAANNSMPVVYDRFGTNGLRKCKLAYTGRNVIMALKIRRDIKKFF